MLGHLIAIYVGSVARRPVLHYVRAARIDDDFGVIARHFAAGETQVVGFPAADLEWRFRHRDDAPAQRVRDFKAGLWHAGSVPQRRRTTRAITIRTPATASTAAQISASRGYPDAPAPASATSASSSGRIPAQSCGPLRRAGSGAGLLTGSVVPTQHR